MIYKKSLVLVYSALFAGAILSAPTAAVAGFQSRGPQRSDSQLQKGRQAPPTNNRMQNRVQAPVQQQRQSPPQWSHARREIVRTPNYVQRPIRVPVRTGDSQLQRYNPPRQIVRPPVTTIPPRQAPVSRPPLERRPQQPIQRPPVNTYNPPKQNPIQRRPVKLPSPYQEPARRPRIPDSDHLRDQRRFTRTQDGRIYDDGVRLRRGQRVSEPWQHRYFRRGHFHYPWYRPVFFPGRSCLSPFAFFYGYCAPYISSAYVNLYPPPVVFVDVPAYEGSVSSGYDYYPDDNLLNDPNLDLNEPGLGHAIDELTETFQNGDIDALVTLIDPNSSIAIYERGRYQYSISGNDYLDLTRDAIEDTPTVQFTIQYLHQVAPNVYTASGRHTYRDAAGRTQTVWVSFVLQDISGQWTLTQVETAPAQYRAF